MECVFHVHISKHSATYLRSVPVTSRQSPKVSSSSKDKIVGFRTASRHKTALPVTKYVLYIHCVIIVKSYPLLKDRKFNSLRVVLGAQESPTLRAHFAGQLGRQQGGGELQVLGQVKKQTEPFSHLVGYKRLL